MPLYPRVLFQLSKFWTSHMHWTYRPNYALFYIKMSVGRQKKLNKQINFELKLIYVFSKPQMRYEISIA